MLNEELDAITSSMKEKLGDENSAMISDDLGELITKNNESINKITELQRQVELLKSKNDTLVSANSRLLQQIPMEKEYDTKVQKEEKKEMSFNFMDAFDNKGHFKQKF
jgi:hypothetical protein